MEEQAYRYCPRCGAAFEKQAENLLVCGSCGLHFYINPHPCNAVIIENEKGEILLVKRKSDPYEGTWDLPGGFMNPNESAEESVIREIEEELRIKPKGFRYLGSYADRYPYKGVNYHTLCFVYAVKIESIPLQASDDIDDYKYFTPNNLPFDELAFSGLKKALRAYLNK